MPPADRQRQGSPSFEVVVASLPDRSDPAAERVRLQLPWLGVSADLPVRTATLFHFAGPSDLASAESLSRRILADPVTEQFTVRVRSEQPTRLPGVVSIFKKPGVMEPWVESLERGARLLGHELTDVRVGRRFTFDGLSASELERVARALLANDAVETISVESDRFPARVVPPKGSNGRVEIRLRDLDASALLALSRERTLSLTEGEMVAIRDHFRRLEREPTDLELETLAQTWSEHCKHKTFTSAIAYEGPAIGSLGAQVAIPNLLAATIKNATEVIAAPFCLSVFHDNAGVIEFDGDMALCFKVETHNHPSAIEPYGGAGTGVGGVVRDILGTGLGARPIANVDVFCVAPLDLPLSELPKGALHPLRVLRGVVAGVRDYGNQMGIPTVAGALHVDARYVGNPLVFCGTVGLIPVDRIRKRVEIGDAIVALGGRTGRDGIHGATFSSVELHADSETQDAGAVQIGNAIAEKKVLDVVLAARDRGLIRAITDCGAGGFSSAVGEMGEHTGARVYLERAPLKYEGLSPAEIWISEAQERMVLAVAPDAVPELAALCAAEDVACTVLGEFTGTGRLEVFHRGVALADLSMEFVHGGLPRTERVARFTPPRPDPAPQGDDDPNTVLLELLASPDIANKEWIVRQYDHEVQGATVIKPLVGVTADGPSDAAVLAPLHGRRVGCAIGIGLCPGIGDIDPYAMACAAIDEALRNVVAVGGDPDHCAILDNFSWGSSKTPESLGALVRASYGCRDAAIALGTPFISGKDSLNNEFRDGDRVITIPHTLVISALAKVPDVGATVTMDFSRPGHGIHLIGMTRAELGGSHYHRRRGRRGDVAPAFHGAMARATFRKLHAAIRVGCVRACHDLSDGGLAVAVAEMALAGDVGARLDLEAVPRDGSLTPPEMLFSESLTRFLVEVPPDREMAFTRILAGVPHARIGVTTDDSALTIQRGNSNLIHLRVSALREAHKHPLTRTLDGRETAHG